MTYYRLALAQWVYGQNRLGWDEVCDGPTPRAPVRDHLAGWILGRWVF